MNCLQYYTDKSFFLNVAETYKQYIKLSGFVWYIL